MSLILNESVVLAKTRSQDLKSVLKLNCWRSGIKDVSLVRQLVNVEVIGLSCNEITTLEDFAYCPKLRELILRQNKISNIAEVAHLQNLPNLTNLWLDENPCVENTYNYRKVVLKALPNLTVLDNKPVTKEELQEIEDLGNDIYEEIHYEGSATSNSGPSSSSGPSQHATNNYDCSSIAEQTTALSLATKQAVDLQPTLSQDDFPTTPSANVGANVEYSANDFNYQNTSDQLRDTNYPVNESRISMSTGNMNNFNANNKSRGSCVSQQSRGLQSFDTSLNGSQHFNCISNNNNNNNTHSVKGFKNRNPNILSAVLCLIKELDYFSCEVVQNALHCRMEETSE